MAAVESKRVGMWGAFKGLGELIQGRFRADIQAGPHMRVDSKKLEYGPGTLYAGASSSLGFEVGGQSYSNPFGFYCRL